jgi:hypothetical protein
MRSPPDGTNRLFALAKIAVNQAKDGALSVQNDLTKDVIGREPVKGATDKVKDAAKDPLVKSQTTESCRRKLGGTKQECCRYMAGDVKTMPETS